MLQKLGLKPNEALDHPWINKALEKAQQKVESRNFEIRKTLLQFDDVMNDQRNVIYEQRYKILSDKNIYNIIDEINSEIMDENIKNTNDDINKEIQIAKLNRFLKEKLSNEGFEEFHQMSKADKLKKLNQKYVIKEKIEFKW